MAKAKLLRLPDDLEEKIQAEADKNNCSLQAMIIKVLSKHCKTPFQEPVRGRPWPKKSE